jgi:transposase
MGLIYREPFRVATAAHAPKATILFDKFHVMRHRGEALDTVRKREHARRLRLPFEEDVR